MWFSRAIIYILLFSLALAANAEIAVVVSKDSSISTMNKREISQIFLSKTRRLPNGDMAVTVESDEQQVQNEFYEEISGKNQKQLKAYWTTLIFTGKGQPPRKLKESKDVLEFVEKNPNAIGYVPLEQIDETSACRVVFVLK